MITLMGATGNIGSKIANALLEKGELVRVIGRSAKKLQPFVDRGAEAAVGDAEDSAFLTGIFTGADSVYVLVPPNLIAENIREYQNQIGANIAESIKNSGVKYVVNLSSMGAHLPDKTGPITGLHDQEQRLNRLEDVNIVHLRPTFFMENTLMNIDMIKNMGINGGGLKADLKMSMIATTDIARFAVRYLINRDFSGKVVKELLGQRDLDMEEATRIIGAKIGKPDLKYSQFPYEDFGQALIQAGLSEDMSKSYVELNQAANDGILVGTETRNPENTTETPFEEFANIFARLFKI